MSQSLKVSEVAAYFATKPHNVLAWIHSGELRAVNVASNANAKRPSWRITPEALVDFETSRANRQAAVNPRGRKIKQADVIEFF